MSQPAAPALRAAVPGLRQDVSDYIEMTKPKVHSLLLFTTVSTMFIASEPSFSLVLLTSVGGYLSPGGAGVVNHC